VIIVGACGGSSSGCLIYSHHLTLKLILQAAPHHLCVVALIVIAIFMAVLFVYQRILQYGPRGRGAGKAIAQQGAQQALNARFSQSGAPRSPSWQKQMLGGINALEDPRSLGKGKRSWPRRSTRSPGSVIIGPPGSRQAPRR
jgi:hypothetical protein